MSLHKGKPGVDYVSSWFRKS